jgi:hypothetical protein
LFFQFDEVPVFKNVACGLVDDRPNEVFGGVRRECLGLRELLGGKCVPPYGWFLSGWDGHLGIGDDAVDDVRRSDFELVLTG